MDLNELNDTEFSKSWIGSLFSIHATEKSNARIIGQRRRRVGSGDPAIPAAAQRSSLLCSWARFWPHRGGIRLAFENLQGEAHRGVHGNVAVQEPRAWIVGLEGDDDETALGHQHDVAPRRVEPVDADVLRLERCVLGLLKDGKVVTVEVYLLKVSVQIFGWGRFPGISWRTRLQDAPWYRFS